MYIYTHAFALSISRISFCWKRVPLFLMEASHLPIQPVSVKTIVLRGLVMVLQSLKWLMSKTQLDAQGSFSQWPRCSWPQNHFPNMQIRGVLPSLNSWSAPKSEMKIWIQLAAWNLPKLQWNHRHLTLMACSCVASRGYQTSLHVHLWRHGKPMPWPIPWILQFMWSWNPEHAVGVSQVMIGSTGECGREELW